MHQIKLKSLLGIFLLVLYVVPLQIPASFRRSAFPPAQATSQMPLILICSCFRALPCKGCCAEENCPVHTPGALGFGAELSPGEPSCNYWMDETFQLSSHQPSLLLRAAALVNIS